MINLSVDGGGSKINILAFDEKYRLLGYGTGAGINTRFDSIENIYTHIENAFCECAKGFYGKHIDNIYCTMVSGCQTFKDILDKLEYTCGSFIRLPEGYTYLLAGGLTETGYVALAGTGSGAVYCNGLNNMLHLGGYGTPIGDDGSGSWIGIRGINAVTRYLAGWGDYTVLKDKLFEYLGVKDNQGFLSALYPSDKSTRSLYARFTKFVGEAADSGDAVALGIVKEAGILMSEQIIGLLKTQYKGSEIPGYRIFNIFACGGAWKCSNFMFDSFNAHLKSIVPNVQCSFGKFDPVVGGVVQSILDNKDDIDSYRSHLESEFKVFSMR